MHFSALIDGQDGAYGVVFPDLPGCTAMGETVDDALVNAAEALRDWAEATVAGGHIIPEPSTMSALLRDADVREALGEGASMAQVLLIRALGRTVKANITLDSGVLAAIDATARRVGSSRSALIERMATERLHAYA